MGLSTPIYGEGKEVEPEIGLTPFRVRDELRDLRPQPCPCSTSSLQDQKHGYESGTDRRIIPGLVDIMSNLDILYAIRFYGIIVQVYRMGFTFDKIDPK